MPSFTLLFSLLFRKFISLTWFHLSILGVVFYCPDKCHEVSLPRVVWLRNVSYMLKCLNTWTTVGGNAQGGLGRVVSLKEGRHWRQVLRGCIVAPLPLYALCFMFPLKIWALTFWLLTPWLLLAAMTSCHNGHLTLCNYRPK